MEKPAATDLNETHNINRRNAIRAFGVAGITALSATAAPAFAEVSAAAPGKTSWQIFTSADAMKRDRSLKEGMLIRLAGYYTPGDGGDAEYLIKKEAGAGDDLGIIPLDNGLYA